MGKIILLHGAKKNIGDFFIKTRAEELLKQNCPDDKIILLPGWKNLESQLDVINSAKAIVISGGPGIQPNMHPNIYPLINNLDKITPPIYTLGSGWKGFPGDPEEIYKYNFKPSSKKLLKKIKFFGVRDYFTMRVLKNHGFNNISMNGCPGWYELEKIGQEFKLPKNKKEIKKIIFTPAQKILYSQQSIKVMKVLREIFPDSEIDCSFQRGLEKDEHTSQTIYKNTQKLKNAAEKLNMAIKDTSYEMQKIEYYKKCDLHIGYRLHAHLYFLSNRLPSILINEDGRGAGLADSLGLPGINAWQKPNFTFGKIKASSLVPQLLKDYLEEEIFSNWNRFSGLNKVLDGQYNIMKNFIINNIK